MAVQAELLNRVMSLPNEERATLARELILSLEPTAFDAGAEAAWEAEIERRLADVDQGNAKLVDWRESVERIRDELRNRDGK
jgi:putative addiction module component (TIGR02574 family)